MAWTYEQSTGWIISPSGARVCKGYSGGPSARNDSAQQAVSRVGPIPVGAYTIEPPVDSPTHGPFALPLTPDPANEMFGRSGFLIHGDRVNEAPGAASEGCVIQPRYARQQVWDSGDRRLQVVGPPTPMPPQPSIPAAAVADHPSQP